MYDVQVTTDLGEVVVLTVDGDTPSVAETIAVSMVEDGYAGTISRQVVDCFTLL
ncbi:MAG: hypothetical protein Q4D28_01300 [Prevotellaceae bacterium]|nr:hypothetical protein [Prevotellaceae bacterium]